MKIQLDKPLSKFDIDSNGIKEYTEVSVNVIINDLYSKSVYCNTDFGRILIKENIVGLEMCTEEEIVNAVLDFVEKEYVK